MKRFILQINYFTIALLVVLIVADGVITYLYHQKDTRKYAVWNDILHTDINADVLIMGNSRAWCMYSTQILDSVLHVNSYNIGMDGSCFNRQKMRYDIYRHYQSHIPDYIIQNVEFFTLEHTVGYEREQFMPYLMYPCFRERVMLEESFSKAELYIPMYRYYMSNVYDDYNQFDFCLYKGYYADDRKWDSSMLESTEPYNAVVDSATLHLFESYIVQTKQDGIEIILVMAPIYEEATRLVLNNNDICRLFRDLSAKYDVPLLDYSNMSICNDTTYFYNGTHLNRRGAEIFSLQLANDLKTIIQKNIGL